MPPTSFSETLARYREMAGLTQLQLAARSKTAHSSVNRWEKGGSLPKRDNVERLDAALDAKGQLLAAWRRSTSGTGLPEWARDIDAIERGARQLSIVAPTLVPGILQCEDYARAVFRAGHPLATPEELAQLVALRCDRLDELTDLTVTAVFPATAVASMPERIRRAQATHLLKWAESGRVDVHLVPDGTALLVPTSPLMLFTLRSGDTAVTSDHAAGVAMVEVDFHDRMTAFLTSALAASLPVTLSLDILRNLT
jgi:transcriptional regulator with XRE-family HTH domain